METKKPSITSMLGPKLPTLTISYRDAYLPDLPKDYCLKVSEPSLEREGYPVTNSFHICYKDRTYVLHRSWNIFHVSERSLRSKPMTTDGVTLTVPFYVESGRFGKTYGVDRWGNPLSIFMVWKLLWIFRKEINWK